MIPKHGRLKDYWDSQKVSWGRPRAFESPQELWELACDYFKEEDNCSWVKVDFKMGYKADKPQMVEVPTAQPYSFRGLQQFLNSKGYISSLADYRRNTDGKYSDFSLIVERIENIIKRQKIDGATVGAYNTTVVMHDLGMVEKKQVEITEKKQVFNINGKDIEI